MIVVLSRSPRGNRPSGIAAPLTNSECRRVIYRLGGNWRRMANTRNTTRVSLSRENASDASNERPPYNRTPRKSIRRTVKANEWIIGVQEQQSLLYSNCKTHDNYCHRGETDSKYGLITLREHVLNF